MSVIDTESMNRVDEAEIELQVEALRKKLTDELQMQAGIDAKTLKPSDTHGLAAAKKSELLRMAAALQTRSDYTEGDAFNKERQTELKEQRAEARAESVRKRAEQEKRMEEQRQRWESEK
jgi:serine/arginine repetitive matrix protein 2